MQLHFPSKLFCFIICCFVLLHPINHNHLLWTFQVAQTLQFMFQILSVFFLFSYFKENIKKHIYYSIFFLIIQNYFFGNGVFMPLLFILGLLTIPKHINMFQILTCLSIFIAFAAIQLTIGKSEKIANGMFEQLPQTMNAFIHFSEINFARYLFVSEKCFGRFTTGISIVIFIVIILSGFINKKTNKKLLLFYLGWFFITSISVPLARGSVLIGLIKIPDYYSVLCFIPFILLFSEIFSTWQIKNLQASSSIHKLKPIILGLVLFFFFLIDNRMTNTYTIRNVRNEAKMNMSINNNSPYYAFDDPHYCDINNPRKDGFYEYMIQNPKEVYIYWKSKTLIPSLNSNLKNE